MSIVDTLNSLDLYEIFYDETAALIFAYEADMLYDGGICESTYGCRGNYSLSQDLTTRTGYRLRCPICGKTKSLFYNSVFTRSNIKVNTVLHLIYCWAQELSCKYTAYECNVSRNTVTNYFQAFRQACNFYFERKHQCQIGGEGLNVEIDETVIAKRKYNVGRIPSEVWVFGGICRETGERFAFQVPDRKASTLLPLIQEYVAPKSIIHSDCWPSYSGIDSLPEDYFHFTVNHTQNFVDPKTKSHTQNIERMWRGLKRVKRRYEGVSRKDIDDHISEYLWRKRKHVHHFNAFSKAIKLISKCSYY